MQVIGSTLSIIGALCASGASGVLLGLVSAIVWPADMALTQENPATFIERWIVPGARAAEPIATPEAQTPSVPRRPEDQIGQPETSGAPSITSQQSQSEGRSFIGKASFYAYTRGKTSSGAPNNPNGLTAAHRTLPFGTRLRVTDMKTSQSVVVVVNDRGPAIQDRTIDLTRGAAEALGMIERGVAQVRMEAVTGTN
jgi:rare lipoprotein A